MTSEQKKIMEHIEEHFHEGSLQIEAVDERTLKGTDREGASLYFRYHENQIQTLDDLPLPVDEQIREAAGRAGKDTYLEGLYSTVEMCELIIQNKQVISDEKVKKAVKLREETLQHIKKRESIPFEKRLGR